MSMYSYDPEHPDLGWHPSIPEPLWVRTPLWRRLLLREPADRPGCCGRTFEDHLTYAEHYARTHWNEDRA